MRPRVAITSSGRSPEAVDWDRHVVEEQRFLEAEVDRLLYVAATRARELLVIGRYQGRPGNRKPAWEALDAKLGRAPVLEIPAGGVVPAGQPVDLSADAAAAATARSEAAHRRANQPSWSTASVTAEARRLPEVVADETEAGTDSDSTHAVVPRTSSHRADAGLAWGTLVHGLLEHAMRHRSATRADLCRLALWLTVEEPSLRGVIDAAIDTALAVVSSDELTSARQASECHEEAPFAVRDVSATLPHVMTGVIDLVHRTSDGWRIVDYKTDVELDDGPTRERYAAQVHAYAEAWARIAGGNVTSSVVSARVPDPE